MTTIVEDGFTGNDYPLTHPTIGWDSCGPRATVTSTSEATGYEDDLAVDPLTYNGWKPTSLPATLTLTLDVPEQISFFGVVGNLASANCSITFESHDGTGWVEHGAIVPEYDAPLMCVCERVWRTQVRITVDGETAPEILSFYAGNALELPVQHYDDAPIDLSERISFTTNETEGGQWTGRYIQRIGTEAAFNIRFVTESWFRTTFKEVARAMQTAPFFISARPGVYPDECDYCWITSPVMMGRAAPQAEFGL